MKKILNLFLVLSLALGLAPDGGSIVVYPFLEKYMHELSSASPQLYDQLSRQKNLPTSFCGIKRVVKSTFPQGLAETHDRNTVDPVFAELNMRPRTPSNTMHALNFLESDILSRPIYKRIPTPPPKVL